MCLFLFNYFIRNEFFFTECMPSPWPEQHNTTTKSTKMKTDFSNKIGAKTDEKINKAISYSARFQWFANLNSEQRAVHFVCSNTFICNKCSKSFLCAWYVLLCRTLPRLGPQVLANVRFGGIHSITYRQQYKMPASILTG